MATKRTLNCIVWVTPNDATVKDIVGDKELPYSQFLKKIWSYWKSKQLTRIERLTKKTA